MILPTRHLNTGQSLIGLAALLLGDLGRPRTVSRLWESHRDDPAVGTFDRFVLALDLLFVTGAIEMDRGLLRKSQ